LLYGDEQIQHERLTVPHVGILERDFVVIPLLDLNPNLQIQGHRLDRLDLLQHTTLTEVADQHWANI
jgi:2-amino-4-hydroxy-6-hydroxymethyldihydropteridine diphosphokinase